MVVDSSKEKVQLTFSFSPDRHLRKIVSIDHHIFLTT